MGTKVSPVLKHKGHDFVTVAPQQTVAWVVKVLTQNRIGAVPVINVEGQLIGIIVPYMDPAPSERRLSGGR